MIAGDDGEEVDDPWGLGAAIAHKWAKEFVRLG
jgi:hypothetical protein